MTLHAALLDALSAHLGADAVLRPDAQHPQALEAFTVDWRRRYRGQALAVVQPRDTAGVAATVRLCAAHAVGIVPQGGNTSLVGGSVPDASGQQIVLNLTRLNRVLDVDVANLSMTAQAGCTLSQVQEAADTHGLLFPLSLASQGSCTIGGNLATNAGGTQVLRYGTARELCLGVEAVTAQGEVWHGLKSLRKDNTGYDLRDLLVGSEGTLGLITAASLKLYPKPRSRLAAWIACDTLEHAVALLNLTRRHLDASLTGFEVMHRHPLRLLQRHLPDPAKALASMALGEWSVLLDASSSQDTVALNEHVQSLLAQAMAQGLAQDAALSSNEAQYRALWAVRESIPLAEKAEALMVKHDIAVPTSRVPEFVTRTQAALDQAFAGAQVVCFGHLGDGNLHYNVQSPPGITAQTFIDEHEHAVNQVVYDIAMELGGTISAEHGIGQLKRDELAQRKAGVDMAWMRAIKQALDPLNTLNPGRLLA